MLFFRKYFYPFAQQAVSWYNVPMKRIQQKHVLLAFPSTRISRVDKMRGVLRFAAEINSWTIDVHQGELTPDTIASADGVIATGFPTAASRHVLESSSVPTVFIELYSNRTANVAHVMTDPDEAASKIANYFLDRGLYKSFAVVAKPHQGHFHFVCTRMLSSIFRKKKFPCSVVTDIRDLDTGLLPLGIFAHDDDLAVKTCHFCREHGLNIPHDVAVLGFSNDTVLCENNTPRISSVEPDFELQGYLAARELNRIMANSRPRSRRELSVNLKQIVERDSTALPQAGAGLVRDGLAFIKANAMRPIGVNDVVKKLKASRRLVELRFRERYNCSILNSILRYRLDATARELLNSTDSIWQVCERCGWKSENGPKKLFRKTYGMSMRAYRQAAFPEGQTPTPIMTAKNAAMTT